MSSAFGTLGVKWARDPISCETCPCECNYGKHCGNYHFEEGTISLYGQCANMSCAKHAHFHVLPGPSTHSVVRRKVDLSTVRNLKRNLIKNRMVCGHICVGLEEIDVVLEKPGFLLFECGVQCFNCRQKDALLCLKNERNESTGLRLPSEQCCDNPKIRFSHVRAQHIKPGGVAKVHSKHLNFSQDSCSSRFRQGIHSGKRIEFTVDELQRGLKRPEDLPRLKGLVGGTKIFVDGNRRLVALQKANSDKVPITMELEDPRSHRGESVLGHAFTSNTDGESILIRRRGRHSYRQNNMDQAGCLGGLIGSFGEIQI